MNVQLISSITYLPQKKSSKENICLICKDETTNNVTEMVRKLQMLSANKFWIKFSLYSID